MSLIHIVQLTLSNRSINWRVNMEKPTDINKFKKWYEEKFNCIAKIDNIFKTYYENVTRTMKDKVIESGFWESIIPEIKELSSEYLIKTQYEFISNSYEVVLVIKPYESFVEKLFRKNVINNKNWPECPDGDWYLIDGSFNRINDLVRTSIVVKYLDGVELLANRLSTIGNRYGNNVKVAFEAREHGYYAAHIDINYSLELPKITWDTEILECSLEIQITTQLQEVLKKLTHTLYEDRRLQTGDIGDNKKWQWNYRSEEFTANYLGHILHYLEGMILEVRDRREMKNGKI
jgi:ppGpp synthetase/RelA/SpoT-type nucleotidyltranferase